MIGSWVGSLQDLFPGMAQVKWQRSNQQLQVWGGTGIRTGGLICLSQSGCVCGSKGQVLFDISVDNNNYSWYFSW